jgi:exosome complex protein LRP1
MADDGAKLRKKLASLMSSLGDLEAQLAPLLTQSLPEATAGLDTVQQAKLHVLVPYLVYDLVFSSPPPFSSLWAYALRIRA